MQSALVRCYQTSYSKVVNGAGPELRIRVEGSKLYRSSGSRPQGLALLTIGAGAMDFFTVCSRWGLVSSTLLTGLGFVGLGQDSHALRNPKS